MDFKKITDPNWLFKLEFTTYLIYLLFIIIAFWIAHWTAVLVEGFWSKIKTERQAHKEKGFFQCIKDGIGAHYTENREDISTLLFFIWVPLVFTILCVIIFNL